MKDKQRQAQQSIKHYIETLQVECDHAEAAEEIKACNCVVAKLTDIYKRGVRTDGARLSNYIDTLKTKMNTSISVNDYQLYKFARSKLKHIRKQLLRSN